MDGPSITLRRAIINFSLFVTVLRFVQWVAVFTKKGGMLYTSSDTRISPYDFLSVMVREVTKCCQLGISTTLITASNLVMTREVAFELFCSHAHTDGQKQYSLHGNAGGLCKGQSSCLALVKKHNYSWKCWTLNTFYNAIQVFLSVTAVRVPLLLLYWKVEEYNEASRPSSVCCSCRQDLRGGGRPITRLAFPTLSASHCVHRQPSWTQRKADFSGVDCELLPRVKDNHSWVMTQKHLHTCCGTRSACQLLKHLWEAALHKIFCFAVWHL